MRAQSSWDNIRGDKNKTSKLTEKQVIAIKTLLNGGACFKKLAKEYNVSDTCIRMIRDGKMWKHVFIVLAVWVCGVKSDPPVKYYSATGSTRTEAVTNAMNACGNPEICNLVGCRLITPETGAK